MKMVQEIFNLELNTSLARFHYCQDEILASALVLRREIFCPTGYFEAAK